MHLHRLADRARPLLLAAALAVAAGIVGHPTVTGSYSLSADLTSVSPVQLLGGYLYAATYSALTTSQ